MFSGYMKINLKKEMAWDGIFHAGYFIRFVSPRFKISVKFENEQETHRILMKLKGV